MTVTFQWENVRKCFAEPNINDLLLEHWNELGVHKGEMPLDPDFDYMIKANETNFFMVWTARDGDLLIGYIAFWVKPHVHYKSTLTAVEDLFLLTASYRKGLTGYRMIKSAIEALKERGVRRVYLHSKVHFEKERGGLKPMFERMGFVHTDNLYSAMI